MNQKTTPVGNLKHCQFCNKILHGRSDQRFCNDTCRNTYNRIKRVAEKVADHENTPEIFRIIRHNYEVLKSTNPAKEPDLYGWYEDATKLLTKGFNPKFFTSIYQESNGTVWYCIFEYGFTLNDNQMVIGWFPQQAEI